MSENTIHPPRREYKPMAHELKTPQPLVKELTDAAEVVEQNPENRSLAQNLFDYNLSLNKFMLHFNLDKKDYESGMEDKKLANGGFTKGAVQAHPYKGVGGKRLVRDKLSSDFVDVNSRQYKDLLFKKLREETLELVESMGRNERIAELGDVFEVFSTILNVFGVDERKFEEFRRIEVIQGEKARERLASKKK